jgi:Mg-chelatase subunit ChlI/Mg-chelatase subunit ChlD
MSLMPFSGFVDLDDLKSTLLALAVDPSIGGMLVLGPKGTGKSSLTRAFAELLPEIEVVIGCSFGCSPSSVQDLCSDCASRLNEQGKLAHITRKMSIVDLPIGVTDDRVIGSLNIEQTLRDGKIHFEPGLLARAHRNILYVDEVNLLPDHIVDLILDAASYGWNVVEREGISLRHPARFILIGTMNPEEGELRPQLLDRFAVSVVVQTVLDPQIRAEVVRRNIEFETNRQLFTSNWQSTQNKIRTQVENAREHLKDVFVSDQTIGIITRVCGKLSVDGYRPDIVATKVARALAALDDRREIRPDDSLKGLKLALSHRTRAGGLKPPATQQEIEKEFREAITAQQLKPPSMSAANLPANQTSGASPQRKNFLRNLYARTPSDTPNMVPGPKKRSAKWRVIGYVLFVAGVTCLYFLVRLGIFLTLMGLLALFVLLVKIFRRSKIGGITSYSLYRRPTTRNQKMATSSIIAWPNARKLLGKGIAEGKQLIEGTPTKSREAKLDLEKIMSRARWWGRRKGVAGRGRLVSYKNFRGTANHDVAIATSIRLAARRGRPLRIRREDLRANVREGRVRASIILLLDSSESMIDSLGKVREAIRAVKKSTARMRDRVGLIVFKGDEAHVLQHPTSNFNLIMQKLTNVGLSGFTPLAVGMMKAVRLARAEEARGYAPVLVMATDGVANVSVPRFSNFRLLAPDPTDDAVMVSRRIASNKWKTIVANMAHVSENGPKDLVVGTQLMMDIARTTRGIYVGFPRREKEPVVQDMSMHTLTNLSLNGTKEECKTY